MSVPQSKLPRFALSPLVEVAISTQFQPLDKMLAAHAGLLWPRFRDRFPRIEQYNPLPPVEEVFGTATASRLSFRVESGLSPPVPRTWFVNDPGTELIQVQQDRFSRNWRKLGEGVTSAPEYPRFGHMRRSFRDDLNEFQEFVGEQHIGQLIFSQCEVTYVNEIERPHRQVDDVMRVWNTPATEYLPKPEQVGYSIHFLIPGPDNLDPIGRLHVDLQPVLRSSDRKEVFLLTLTARGRPDGDGIEGVLRFVDVGHEWTVRGFTELTSDKMHEQWRRQ